MSLLQNPKTWHIIKIGLLYTLFGLIVFPLIDMLGGEGFREVWEKKLSNLPKLLLSIAGFFMIGLLLGWLNWKKKQNQKG